MFIVWILIGIVIGLVLSCKFPRICGLVTKAWNYLKGKFGGQAGE
jgi:hypothetical protein